MSDNVQAPPKINWKDASEEQQEFLKRQAERAKNGEDLSNKPRAEFVKFEVGKTYNLRLLGPMVKFYRYYRYNGRRHIFVYVDPDKAREADEYLRLNFPDIDLRGQHRAAVNVRDLDDNNKSKIMEGPYYGLFLNFLSWSEDNDFVEPGSMNGENWRITVRPQSGNRRTYSARTTGPAPISTQEAQQIKQEGQFYDLAERYALTAIEDLPAKLGLIDAPDTSGEEQQPTPTQTTQEQQPAAVAPAAAAPSTDNSGNSGDPLVGW